MTHPTHKTRYSDSSIYDEVCTLCGGTDASGDVSLNTPCPAARDAKVEEGIAAQVALSDNNVKLQTLDEAVRTLEPDPEKQLGLLIIASVLAVRRFCVGKGIFDRGRRIRVIKNVVSQMDAKLRSHVWREAERR